MLQARATCIPLPQFVLVYSTMPHCVGIPAARALDSARPPTLRFSPGLNAGPLQRSCRGLEGRSTSADYISKRGSMSAYARAAALDQISHVSCSFMMSAGRILFHPVSVWCTVVRVGAYATEDVRWS